MHADPKTAFLKQARYCTANDAPVTAALCLALVGALDDETATGRAVLAWQGDPTFDALPLRLVGGVHALWRAGRVPGLQPVFAATAPSARAAALMRDVLHAHDAELLPWLDGPPQTNEPGRSAQLMTGLLEIAARHGPAVELLEIGSSAGLNLLIDRYRIALGPVTVGPEAAAVQLVPEWRGAPPPAVPIRMAATRGVEIAPIDATTDAGANRLLAYVWADHAIRFARLEAALGVLRAHPPRLDAGDAADWIEARLAEPQAEGTTRVLMHSIVWQYLGAERQARITAAMEAAGIRATPARPLGWVRVEANRTVNQHEITVRSWPGHSASMLIGHAHAHGFWVERLAAPVAGVDLP